MKYFFTKTLMVLCAVMLTACFERSDAGTVTETNQAVLEQTAIWEAIDAEWGRAVRQLEIPITIQQYDMTCDGNLDLIASRLNQDSPEGTFFDVIVMTHEYGRNVWESISLPFGGDDLCAISEDMAAASLRFESSTAEDVAELFTIEVCHNALVIDDGMCDAHRYYWRKQAAPAQERLVLFRN